MKVFGDNGYMYIDGYCETVTTDLRQADLIFPPQTSKPRIQHKIFSVAELRWWWFR